MYNQVLSKSPNHHHAYIHFLCRSVWRAAKPHQPRLDDLTRVSYKRIPRRSKSPIPQIKLFHVIVNINAHYEPSMTTHSLLAHTSCIFFIYFLCLPRVDFTVFGQQTSFTGLLLTFIRSLFSKFWLFASTQVVNMHISFSVLLAVTFNLAAAGLIRRVPYDRWAFSLFSCSAHTNTANSAKT